jgi:hypothetical protein
MYFMMKKAIIIPSQIQTLRSLEHEAKKAPSFDQAVHLTSFSWPSRLAIISKVESFLRFQITIVVSKLAVAIQIQRTN